MHKDFIRTFLIEQIEAMQSILRHEEERDAVLKLAKVDGVVLEKINIAEAKVSKKWQASMEDLREYLSVVNKSRLSDLLEIIGDEDLNKLHGEFKELLRKCQLRTLVSQEMVENLVLMNKYLINALSGQTEEPNYSISKSKINKHVGKGD